MTRWRIEDDLTLDEALNLAMGFFFRVDVMSTVTITKDPNGYYSIERKEVEWDIEDE